MVTGATNQIYVYDSLSKSSTECKGLEITSEGLFACVSQDNSHFSISFKDGTIVVGDLETKTLLQKTQIGDIVKGSNHINQSCFDTDGNLYVPGRKSV